MFELDDSMMVKMGTSPTAAATPTETECGPVAHLRPLLALPGDALLQQVLGEALHGPNAPWIWGYQPPLPSLPVS